MTYEHKVEVVPADPARATEALNRLGREGWEVVSAESVVTQTSPLAEPQAGLYCVLKRAAKVSLLHKLKPEGP